MRSTRLVRLKEVKMNKRPNRSNMNTRSIEANKL